MTRRSFITEERRKKMKGRKKERKKEMAATHSACWQKFKVNRGVIRSYSTPFRPNIASHKNMLISFSVHHQLFDTVPSTVVLQHVALSVCVCGCTHLILSPWRLRGCGLFLRHARLCVTVHPSLGQLAMTSGGCRGNSLFKVKLY